MTIFQLISLIWEKKKKTKLSCREWGDDNHGHDFISQVPLSCFIEMFYIQVLKYKVCYHFISSEPLISWKASQVFIEGYIYRRNLPVTGEGGKMEKHTPLLM